VLASSPALVNERRKLVGEARRSFAFHGQAGETPALLEAD
jgi:hypothetical protein